MDKARLEEVKTVMIRKTGDSSTKHEFLGRSFPDRTSFLLMKYEGNEDDSLLCKWHGGSQLQGPGYGSKECSSLEHLPWK